ncbi:MAG: ATP-binding protein [Myxococcota bacterium]
MESPDFQLLFEASPEVLLVLLPDRPRFTMVAATQARFDVTHTDRSTLGKGLFEVFPDNPDDPEATGTNNLRASLDRVIATRRPDTMAVQKYDIRAADGTFERKYWSPKNIPVLAPSGEISYILHRVEDVTGLVQASELGQELRDRTREMEREVVKRSRELAEANQHLREANIKLGELDAAKTAFFSNVSHEFRTPLTLILGPLEAAMKVPNGALGGAELATVHRNAARLLRLVNSLLDFSRLEAGRVDATFAPTDLAALTSGLAGAFQSLLEDAGLRLVVDCPKLPAPIYVDPSQWEKIVLNLISNAFKFTFAGEITVRLEWHGDHVELHVQDTGTGIPESELPHIFERFHRVEGARGRSYEGSGIGLSLVHELVRLHGGSIRVTSTIDQGSTFIVSLPVGSAHLPPDRVVASSGKSKSGEMVRGHILEAMQWTGRPDTGGSSEPVNDQIQKKAPAVKKGRILVADDNADMREYITRLLSPDWEVTAVANGKAALAAAEASVPELILSDVMMPELDGVALLAALRANPSTRSTPVILLSARAGEEARVEGLETGADEYLVKPFSARELVTRVNTQVEMAKVRRQAADAARQLADTRARLVETLEQKNQELRASYDQLATAQAQLVQSAKMASLGELVAGIAHEINNPLAFLLSHLKTIARVLVDLEPRSNEGEAELPAVAGWRRARERLQEMELGLTRIHDLVLKLRTFSRLDEGEVKRVSIRECVEAALTILGHRLDDRIQVTTRFAEPDDVECYAGLLNQALVNLLTNAIDAIDGPGSITITTEMDEDTFTIRISDSGCGIPEQVRERVFEPFFTTKPLGQGTGLGLSITYSIVKTHHGSIELVPGETGGTSAIMRLPRQVR